MLKTLGLHCCSERFEQLSNRISNYRANSGGCIWQRLVRSLQYDDCRSGGEFGADPRVHWPWVVSVPHRSKCRHECRKALHWRSLCVTTRSVCSYDHIAVTHCLFESDWRGCMAFMTLILNFFQRVIVVDNVLFIAICCSCTRLPLTLWSFLVCATLFEPLFRKWLFLLTSLRVIYKHEQLEQTDG